MGRRSIASASSAGAAAILWERPNPANRESRNVRGSSRRSRLPCGSQRPLLPPALPIPHRKPTFRASDMRRARNSRSLPGAEESPFASSASRYCAGTSSAESSSRSSAAGHPPRQTRRASWPRSVSTGPLSKRPSNKPERDTLPWECPDSESVMGSIWSREILPEPVWFVSPLAGRDEPVRMKSPLCPGDESTSVRTASHSEGSSCHSSITRGRFPARTARASIPASSLA